MITIDKTAVKTWQSNLPTELSVRCSGCRKHRFFAIGTWQQHGPMRYAHASCPGCQASSFFVVTGFANSNDLFGGGTLYMDPSVPQREASAELSKAMDTMPELQRDYLSTVDFFNDDDPASLVLTARRLLEGLAKHYVNPASYKDNLATDLGTLAKERNLAPTIERLSTTIRKAGNMGAHFGASRVTTEIAVSAMQMVEQLLTLHLLLDSRVSNLEKLIGEAHAKPIPGIPAIAPQTASP